MRSRSSRLSFKNLVALGVAVALFMPFTATSFAAKPPVGKTYYTVMVGLASAYDISTSCFEFGASSVCSTDGDTCGSWLRMDTIGKQTGFTFDMSLIEDESLVRIRGEGRLDTLGRKSSIGGTGRISGAGPRFNYSFAGREMPKARCLAMLGDAPGGGEGTLIVGSGSVASESRSVSGFSGVTLSGVGRLEIRHSGAESLTVRADDNLLPYLESEVRNGILFLGNDAGINFRTDNEIVYELTVSELSRLTLSGVTFADVRGVDTDLLTVNVSGVSAARIRGNADRQRVTVSGVSSYDASRLTSRRVDIDISGVSSARVRVSEQLSGSVAGLCSLEYIGNPTVNVTVDSGSTLKRVG